MTRFLLGSTAERVVTHAPCPVIIAKGKIGPVRRILLCDSGAQSVSLFNRFVTQLGRLIEGEEAVTILHVMSQMSAGPGVIGRQLRASAEELMAEHAPEGQLLEQDIRLLERLNIHPQPKIRHGLVVDEILAEARSGDYDLVVIGAHRYEGWQNILLDDLARKIVAQVDPAHSGDTLKTAGEKTAGEQGCRGEMFRVRVTPAPLFPRSLAPLLSSGAAQELGVEGHNDRTEGHQQGSDGWRQRHPDGGQHAGGQR